MMMGVREIDRSLEQWQMGVKDLRRRMVLAPTPRERERWYAMLLLAQGLTAAATAEALERDPHTIGRWAAAFGEGGPAALIFEQTGGSPPYRGRYFRAILMTLISDGARSMIFEPENSALARSQGPEGLCSTPANSKVS